MDTYATTRARVEDYFDRKATTTWDRLTSEAKVSRIRQTVREGRDRMRALMLSRLPADLRGMRVLDAGCGTGLMTAELAARGAKVVAADISPKLIAIATERLDPSLKAKVRFHAGDMTDAKLGSFDHVMAMDSLIYYRPLDLAAALERLALRAPKITFTVAPKTPLLMVMWNVGKLVPGGDRSPRMVPHDHAALSRDIPGLTRIERVTSGFYISECLEVAR
ncbi:magnesium protoporphyrin IX methyltransferase [Stagnihabitans tardus]|uniref:Magnesium protoporphyrin IX methyltransferase n=1 Tax=Stagnihabitans tardus TaxID=2699202 RepID=A0AAE4YAD2_9RHOB|nr:magnesium protoporphyrin IX methyltransferase [Stagnihabitans tardus]NBZ86395.1 magnesium protoporphyrin IX methyltransferase [Stagnihabitans tardus]